MAVYLMFVLSAYMRPLEPLFFSQKDLTAPVPGVSKEWHVTLFPEETCQVKDVRDQRLCLHDVLFGTVHPRADGCAESGQAARAEPLPAQLRKLPRSLRRVPAQVESASDGALPDEALGASSGCSEGTSVKNRSQGPRQVA